MYIYLIIIGVMSLITFIAYGLDKRKAKKGKWRTPEKVLLGMSFLFGSIGGLFGMYLFRHKTQHWYFVVVNFGSLILHIVLGYLIYKGIIF